MPNRNNKAQIRTVVSGESHASRRFLSKRPATMPHAIIRIIVNISSCVNPKSCRHKVTNNPPTSVSIDHIFAVAREVIIEFAGCGTVMSPEGTHMDV